MKIEDKELLNKGKVLIDFWANWCGPCKVLKPIVEEFANESKTTNVYFCNVDEDSELAQKYSIRSIPTLVYLENGEIKHKQSGVMSLLDIKKITDQ
jgi:thioredoxin 1